MYRSVGPNQLYYGSYIPNSEFISPPCPLSHAKHVNKGKTVVSHCQDEADEPDSTQ